MGELSRYIIRYPGQLSLAILPWVSAMSNNKSWSVNRYVTRFTSRVFVVSRHCVLRANRKSALHAVRVLCPRKNFTYFLLRVVGTKYMVVDCGGGTVDITVYEMISDTGKLKELYMATGGPYGSTGMFITSPCQEIIHLCRAIGQFQKRLYQPRSLHVKSGYLQQHCFQVFSMTTVHCSHRC